MRKTLYFVALSAVAIVLILNVIASRRVDWLVIRYEEVLKTKITTYYGLRQTCSLTLSEIPGPGGDENDKITYRKYDCRPFPNKVKDHCEQENKAFCAAWTSATYLQELAIGMAAVSLAAILFGMSTHSRRRRIWRSASVLMILQGICQIATFALITDQLQRATYPTFDRARPGAAYVIQTVSWITTVLITAGVVIAGLSAEAGHRWAAGNRAYHPISP
ncbi:hypothetical protein BJ165DRAFT_943325 [Panaeolus papilionaceus]|nr:hypothetical protein BJ165DRAFT_943325 [Panaeolus papilionaceus]